MEYELGARLDIMLDNEQKTLKALEYIIAALDDNDIKPKEVKKK